MSEVLSLNKLPQEIRDDCRGDRTISKSALITIAKKKQLRGMLTAYQALKVKLQKGKGVRQKTNPNDPLVLFEMMGKSIAKIKTIDTSTWTDEQKTIFQDSLVNMKAEIESYLSTVAPVATQ